MYSYYPCILTTEKGFFCLKHKKSLAIYLHRFHRKGTRMSSTSHILKNVKYSATIFWSLYPIGHYIRPEYNRIHVFCTRKSGHYIRMATINMATISGVHEEGTRAYENIVIPGYEQNKRVTPKYFPTSIIMTSEVPNLRIPKFTHFLVISIHKPTIPC